MALALYLLHSIKISRWKMLLFMGVLLHHHRSSLNIALLL